MAVLDGPILTHGPQGKQFEADFAACAGKIGHAVATSSCMAALHLSYLALGIGAGDEVLVPSMTHVATVHAVEWVGARPVFVDCDAATGNVTAQALEAAITSRTRAISIVHFIGIPCDMTAVMELAERHRLKVIEDCALALGARWRGTHVGLFGDTGCFSFYPVKHITTAEGGMLLTQYAELATQIGLLRAFGVDRSHGERSMPGYYDVVTLGLNYRMSELQAALGCSQLRRFDENLRRRHDNWRALRKSLESGGQLRVLQPQSSDAESSCYCLVAVLPDWLAARRNEVVVRLKEAGVGTSIYYPQPVPEMTYYRDKYNTPPTAYQQAQRLSSSSIALPVGWHLDLEDVRYVGDTLNQIVEEMKP